MEVCDARGKRVCGQGGPRANEDRSCPRPCPTRPRPAHKRSRGPYYECNVRGYAVIPGVDIRSCLYRSSDRLVKAKFTKTLTF